ncbi:MAG: prepilin-type N-terminal cleavage/methylation domain-containing protein [Minisyncoccia bacterium]|jgi:prepilin-type N-terminal cleavage/methylation domain-containing protein
MKKGFTLVEALIAVGLFSILVGVAWGGFTNALRTQRQITAMISVQSNANLILEQMAREMRTGYLFCHLPGSNTPDGGDGACARACTVENGGAWQCDNLIAFFSATPQEVQYRLENGAIKREIGGSGNFDPVTSDNVDVRHLSFYLQGQTEGDNWTPRITISMEVSPSSTYLTPGYNTVLDLQTTVSARAIDCTSGPTASC